MADVTPHIVVRDAGRAAQWYERALGAEIGSRIPVPDGRFMQIELLFGDSPVMVADEFPEWGAVSPLTLGGTYGALTITTDAVDGLWSGRWPQARRCIRRCRTPSGASVIARSSIRSATGGVWPNTSRTFRRTRSYAARPGCLARPPKT